MLLPRIVASSVVAENPRASVPGLISERTASSRVPLIVLLLKLATTVEPPEIDHRAPMPTLVNVLLFTAMLKLLLFATSVESCKFTDRPLMLVKVFAPSAVAPSTFSVTSMFCPCTSMPSLERFVNCDPVTVIVSSCPLHSAQPFGAKKTAGAGERVARAQLLKMGAAPELRRGIAFDLGANEQRGVAGRSERNASRTINLRHTPAGLGLTASDFLPDAAVKMDEELLGREARFERLFARGGSVRGGSVRHGIHWRQRPRGSRSFRQGCGCEIERARSVFFPLCESAELAGYGRGFRVQFPEGSENFDVRLERRFAVGAVLNELLAKLPQTFDHFGAELRDVSVEERLRILRRARGKFRGHGLIDDLVKCRLSRIGQPFLFLLRRDFLGQSFTEKPAADRRPRAEEQPIGERFPDWHVLLLTISR